MIWVGAELDYQSLARLRITNSTFRPIVSGLPVWKEAHTIAYDTLWALKQTRLIDYYRSQDLHRLLFNDRCIDYERHGPFLYPPRLERVCYNHLTTGETANLRIVMSVPALKATLGLKDRQMRSLPQLWAVPGEYTTLGPLDTSFEDPWELWMQRRRIRLVRAYSAIDVAIKSHSGCVRSNDDIIGAVFSWYYSGDWEQKQFRELALTSVATPSCDRKTKYLETGLWCKSCKHRRQQMENIEDPIDIAEAVVEELRLYGGNDNEDNKLVKDFVSLYQRMMSCSRQSYNRQEFVAHRKCCKAWWKPRLAKLHELAARIMQG